MEFKQVKLVCFSPTGTTRTVLESIAKGIGADDVEHIDLTLPEGAHRTITPFSDELVLIGAPVYGGRLPVDAIHRFKQLKASKTPAILIVMYGNRDLLSEVISASGGKRPDTEYPYDLSAVFTVLPRVPVLLLFNDAEPPFPARTLILFERRAEHFLDAECLVMVCLALHEHLKRAEKAAMR